jgi:hypothetical protein
MGLSNIIKNTAGRITRSSSGSAASRRGTGGLNASGTGRAGRPGAGGIAGRIRSILRGR